MRITNEMLAKIHEWISQDKIIVAKNKRLVELAVKRRAALEEHRKAVEALFWQTARAIKTVDWRLSLADRRRAATDCAMNNFKTLQELHRTMRRQVRKLDTAIELTIWSIGKRRGYLRYKFEQQFVLIAQRERIRMQRCIVPERLTAGD